LLIFYHSTILHIMIMHNLFLNFSSVLHKVGLDFCEDLFSLFRHVKNKHNYEGCNGHKICTWDGLNKSNLKKMVHCLPNLLWDENLFVARKVILLVVVLTFWIMIWFQMKLYNKLGSWLQRGWKWGLKCWDEIYYFVSC
jgi:hypothetical protein